MAEYYLISQLPSLDAAADALPISEERFFELCGRFLSRKAMVELKKLSLTPPKEPYRSYSSFINAWNDSERELRFTLAGARAERMNRSFTDGEKGTNPALAQAVRSAVQMESPLEAESFLSEYRIAFLESIRPSDSFSEDFVFYYLLKLKLLKRIWQFDTQRGEAAYRNIYASIMDGDRLGQHDE